MPKYHLVTEQVVNRLETWFRASERPRLLKLFSMIAYALEEAGHSLILEEQSTGVVALVNGERLRFFARDEPRYENGKRTARVTLRVLPWCRVGHLRLNWRDTKSALVEDMLPDFIAGLELIATAVSPIRAAEMQAALVRRDREDRQLLEAYRSDLLSKHLEAWEQSKRIRSFVESVRSQAEATHSPDIESILTWCSWAEQKSFSIDPLSQGVKEFVRLYSNH